MEETKEEQAKIRNAELDCRAFILGSIRLAFPERHKTWVEDLTDAEKAEVKRRAEGYEAKIYENEDQDS